MLKMVIAGWNAAPGAPRNWDPKRDGDCGALPVRYWPRDGRLDGSGPKIQWCESAWEPTPAELEMLKAGGHVVLRVWGWQVPVAVYAEPAAETGQAPTTDTLAPAPIGVSPQTYREIRALLIKRGDGGTFERRPEGGEMIDMGGLAIFADPERDLRDPNG